MRFDDFEQLILRLTTEVPPEFLDGVVGVEASRHTLPHPTWAGIFTLGECIPVPSAGEGVEGVRSRLVLYHGSFSALAQQDDSFSWRDEAWETLTHELRHHLEWRARVPDLEAFDDAAEANFARHEGEPFDPLFFLDGEAVVPGVFRLDDDYFLDQPVDAPRSVVTLDWHGVRYEVTLSSEVTLPAVLTVAGVSDPPPGDLVVVLHRPVRLRDLFRTAPEPWIGEVTARPVAAPGAG